MPQFHRRIATQAGAASEPHERTHPSTNFGTSVGASFGASVGASVGSTDTLDATDELATDYLDPHTFDDAAVSVDQVEAAIQVS